MAGGVSSQGVPRLRARASKCGVLCTFLPYSQGSLAFTLGSLGLVAKSTGATSVAFVFLRLKLVALLPGEPYPARSQDASSRNRNAAAAGQRDAGGGAGPPGMEKTNSWYWRRMSRAAAQDGKDGGTADGTGKEKVSSRRSTLFPRHVGALWGGVLRLSVARAIGALKRMLEAGSVDGS